MIQAILFDLDDTLYPPHSGVMEQIRALIHRYICGHLDLSDEESEALRKSYFQTYGTTMRGLQLNNNIDPDEFLRFVHDLPIEEYIQPNPELDAILATIPQRKIVFTNASREHAQRVLDALGISRHFERIVDVRDMEGEGKPQPAAYRRTCDLLGLRPKECVLVEDNIRNLRPAKEEGMTTVLVQEQCPGSEDSVDFCLERIEEIGQIVPFLSTGQS